MRLQRIVEHAVDGEVPALCVFFRCRVDDVFGTASVEIGAFCPKCRHFNVAGVAGAVQQDDAKTGADGPGSFVAKQIANLLGAGIGRDVIILGSFFKKQVAHAATGPIGDVPGSSQAGDHVDGELLRGRHCAMGRLLERSCY